VDKGSESLFKAVAIAGADNEVRERERERERGSTNKSFGRTKKVKSVGQLVIFQSIRLSLSLFCLDRKKK
jgi:hypothetical protein